MGIRPKLFLLFFALGILPVLLLNIVNYWYGVSAVRGLLRAEVERDAAEVARAVEAREREQEAGLMGLARARALRDYIGGSRIAGAAGLPSDVRASIGAFLLENQKYYAAITCLDKARRPLFRVEPNWHGEKGFDLDSLSFQTGDSLTASVLPDERVWTTTDKTPLRSPILRESSGIIIRYTVPVFTGEEMAANASRGALVLDLKLDNLLKETVYSLARSAPSARESNPATPSSLSPPSRLIVILDRTGRIVYHTNEALIYQSITSATPHFKRVGDAMTAGESGWKFYDSNEGGRWLAAYLAVAPLDLSAAVAGDYTAATASLHWMGWISIGLSVLVGLGVALLLSKVAGRAARSIERVTEGAVAIAGGNLNQRIEVRSSDEIHLLADSFNRMTDRLREQIAREAETRQFQAFMRLSAMLTHDLKNAISSLSLLVSNMERQFHNEEFRLDAMRSLKEATTKLRGLVARLSEPVQSLSGEYQRPRAVDLIPIIKRVLATAVGPASELHDVETRLPAQLVATVDAARLEKVIENLVLNALEAMGSERKGKLTIEGGTEKDGTVFFSISDTGPGMSEDFQRTRLFRPFATTKSKGIGLGLYTCREVIRAHGGQIDVKSQKDTGTTFRVVLPSNQITGLMVGRR